VEFDPADSLSASFSEKQENIAGDPILPLWQACQQSRQVGWVERSETHRSGRRGTGWRTVDRAYRSAAGRVSTSARATSLHDRSCRYLAGSPPRDSGPCRRGDADFAMRWRLIQSGFSHSSAEANGFTSISIRSSTATRSAYGTGHNPRFAAGRASAPIRRTGPAVPTMKSPGLVNDDGFRSRATHPTCLLLKRDQDQPIVIVGFQFRERGNDRRSGRIGG
jgi:hypothetical protein